MDQRFTIYTMNSQTMNLDQFLKFFKDFNVFPALISIVKIKQIFQVLIDQHFQSIETNKAKIDYIDKAIFNQSLLLISFYLKTTHQSQNDIPLKLTSLLELMSRSDWEKEITSLSTTQRGKSIQMIKKTIL